MTLKWMPILVGVILLGAISFLFLTPKVEDSRQAKLGIVNVYLPFNLKYWINCDSPEFMRLSENPAGLLEEQNTRQARPGIVFLAHLIRVPLQYIIGPLVSWGQSVKVTHELVESGRFEQYRRQYIPDYVAYILINFGVILLGLLLFVRIVENDSWFSWYAFMGVCLLGVNDLMKAFFFSPHTQMFNIMFPLLAVYLGLKALKGLFFSTRWVLIMSLLVGLLMLIYSSCFVIFPCWVVLGCVCWWRDRSSYPFKTLVMNSVLSLIFISLPTLLWMGFVTFQTGAFYNHELSSCNQVVWIFNSLHQGGAIFIQTLWTNFLKWMPLVIHELLPVGTLGGISALLWLISSTQERTHLGQDKDLFIVSLLVAILFFFFYFFVGLYEGRLAISVMPPLLVIVIRILMNQHQSFKGIKQKVFLRLCSLVTASLVMGSILKGGPYG